MPGLAGDSSSNAPARLRPRGSGADHAGNLEEFMNGQWVNFNVAFGSGFIPPPPELGTYVPPVAGAGALPWFLRAMQVRNLPNLPPKAVELCGLRAPFLLNRRVPLWDCGRAADRRQRLFSVYFDTPALVATRINSLSS